MKDLWKTIKMCSYILALPLLATAVASAHNWATTGTTVEAPALTETSRVVPERSTIVNIDKDGYVNGRIVSIQDKGTGLANLKVKFVQNGKIVKVVYTENDGTFRARNLAEGIYSFVASGKKAFVAHGVKVVKSNGSDQLITAAISPGFSRIYDIISSGVENQNTTTASKSEFLLPTTSGNQVQVIDGAIRGKIYAANSENISSTQIFLFQNQTQIAKVNADANGTFSFSNLKPGVYDFVAAGPNGYAAASFEAIQQAKTTPMIQVGFAKQDSELPAPGAEMPIILNGPTVQGVVEQNDETITVAPGQEVQFLGDQNAMGTAFGEDYFIQEDDGFVPLFGGGGGGIHGVGHHDWIKKAALAIAIIALADDDDPNDSTPFNINN